MSSNKSRLQSSAKSNRCSAGLRSALPLGTIERRKKVLYLTTDILSKKCFRFKENLVWK